MMRAVSSGLAAMGGALCCRASGQHDLHSGPREVRFREVINAVRYLVRSGWGWRMLPVNFGHWRTLHGSAN